MNASTLGRGEPRAIPPRFDAKFIEEHRLVERYLDDKLPVKGARDLENWCRANPDYLDRLNLSGRAQASLKLLEAIGTPLDLREPPPAWWKSPYLAIGLGTVALASLIACWALLAKNTLLRGELDDARTRLRQGSLVQPATETSVQVVPDRASGLGRAKTPLNGGAPQLVDLHVDVNYSKAEQFRLVVDKQDQGRAMVVNNLVKDSNGDLRLTLNSSGLSPGIYAVRIESLPLRGNASPVAEGWFTLEVR